MIGESYRYDLPLAQLFWVFLWETVAFDLKAISYKAWGPELQFQVACRLG